MATRTRVRAELEELVKQGVNASSLKREGRSEGGCISEGITYSTDTGRVFVKVNRSDQARQMFEGEAASLHEIKAMGVMKVPTPIKVLTIPSGGALFIMENLDIVGPLSSGGRTLGEQVARLHLQNRDLARKEERQQKSVHKEKECKPAVTQFGFDVTTYLGYFPQKNEWTNTWEEYYARKIQHHVDMIQQQHHNRTVGTLWNEVLVKLPGFFRGLHIWPALLHADLWSGNVAETKDGPVTFDPACFYGHAEFDMSISCTFGGFPPEFFSSYFSLIPKEQGFDRRLELYILFNHLNHWNHFGGKYKSLSINALKQLAAMQFD